MNKIAQVIFIILVGTLLYVPLLTTNLKDGIISKDENRVLAKKPMLVNDGVLNRQYPSDFEAWINDNIGFREQMAASNALVQYYVFRQFSNNMDYYLGPDEELNYATSGMIEDYQHFNLYSEEYLKEFASKMQCLQSKLAEQGTLLIYYQCWDKHSIYPEQFPDSVLQYGDYSKTDGIVKVLQENTDVKVVSAKQALIKEKEKYPVYSIWGDPTHWTQRGAYLGYKLLMDTINANSPESEYRILQEEDYLINRTDQGKTLTGGIHREELLEEFIIKDPEAIVTNNQLGEYEEDPRHIFYSNARAGNESKVLIIGDSYFKNYIIDDLAESFHETIFIHGDHMYEMDEILQKFEADIVIIECAERVDRTESLIKTIGYR